MDVPERDAHHQRKSGVGNSSQQQEHVIFYIETRRPKKDGLKALWEALGESGQAAFRAKHGNIACLIDILPDWDLIKAFMRFFSSSARCFIMPDFELTVTVDEYHQLLWGDREMGAEIYTPDMKSIHPDSRGIQIIMERTCGIIWRVSYEHIQTRRVGSLSRLAFDWQSMHNKLGDKLHIMTLEHQVNFLALGIYGLIIFPFDYGGISDDTLAMFDWLCGQKFPNTAPIIVAETLSTIIQIRARGKGKFLACAELMTVWAYSHVCFTRHSLPDLRSFSGKEIIPNSVEVWHRYLLSLPSVDVNFKAPWMKAVAYLRSPPNRYIILLGVHGACTYSSALAMRQFGVIQDIPQLSHMQEMFEYSVEKQGSVQLARSTWEEAPRFLTGECKRVLLDYFKWKKAWIEHHTLPWEVPRTKEDEIRELMIQGEMDRSIWVQSKNQLIAQIDIKNEAIQSKNFQIRQLQAELKEARDAEKEYKEQCQKLIRWKNRNDPKSVLRKRLRKLRLAYNLKIAENDHLKQKMNEMKTRRASI